MIIYRVSLAVQAYDVSETEEGVETEIRPGDGAIQECSVSGMGADHPEARRRKSSNSIRKFLWRTKRLNFANNAWKAGMLPARNGVATILSVSNVSATFTGSSQSSFTKDKRCRNPEIGARFHMTMQKLSMSKPKSCFTGATTNKTIVVRADAIWRDYD